MFTDTPGSLLKSKAEQNISMQNVAEGTKEEKNFFATSSEPPRHFSSF